MKPIHPKVFKDFQGDTLEVDLAASSYRVRLLAQDRTSFILMIFSPPQARALAKQIRQVADRATANLKKDTKGGSKKGGKR